MNTVRAIYPGTFDPLTNGHLDLIARGSKIFDHLVVAILNNSEKQPLFSVPERVEMIQETTREFDNVSVSQFDGLLVDFARLQHAQALLRGIRAISDYEYELQMALMNRTPGAGAGNSLHDARGTIFLRQLAADSRRISPGWIGRGTGAADRDRTPRTPAPPAIAEKKARIFTAFRGSHLA